MIFIETPSPPIKRKAVGLESLGKILVEDSLEKKRKICPRANPPFLRLELWIPGRMLSLMCHIEMNIAKEKESRSLVHNTFTLQVIRSSCLYMCSS